MVGTPSQLPEKEEKKPSLAFREKKKQLPSKNVIMSLQKMLSARFFLSFKKNAEIHSDLGSFFSFVRKLDNYARIL